MAIHRISRGLDLPIAGAPRQDIEPCRSPRRVAVVASDYVGLRPRMQVGVGDRVRRGQVLFEEKRAPGVRHTAPAAGTVAAIHRGERRSLQSVVIELGDSERAGDPEHETFASFLGADPAGLDRQAVVDLLLESGLWNVFRARPFGKVPDPATAPHSIFVTAIDTHPLAADPEVVLEGREADFAAGLRAIAKLTPGKTFVCQRVGSRVRSACPDEVQVEEFDGAHPAGTPGVHIHTLDPVRRRKTVWHLNYQDAISAGVLFRAGRLDPGRVIALGGPQVKHPRLLRTRLGASLDDTLEGELREGETRVISGSVLCGRWAAGEVHGYLGPYHLQVTALREERKREFLGWLSPGLKKYSAIPVVLSKLLPRRRFAFTTSLNGSRRAMVPIGLYERVFPFDMVPTYLLRSIAVEDIEDSERLGCLELDEEDVALCTFVCPGKHDYGPALRRVLDRLEKEG